MKVCNVCYIDLPNSSFDTYYSRKVKGEKTTVLKPSCKSCEKENLLSRIGVNYLIIIEFN